MTRFSRGGLAVLAAVLSCVPEAVAAAGPLAGVERRFAKADVAEVPDFARHVLPLLGRLGCNGRACHGSFQGQGGFRLSLFGYDFEADRAALLGGDEPRVDMAKPTASLILRKPTLGIAHEGGRRFAKDGWEHRLLLKWIEGGAKGHDEAAAPRLVGASISPTEIVFAKEAETVPVRVVAEWSDGVREDVTALCRFRSNDESIATVDAEGKVASVGAGDTHVIAFYDNATVAAPVLRPVGPRYGAKYPSVPTPTKIDELVVAKLRKLGIVPSEECTDAEFLRRASLDLTGTLPRPEEIRAFLADGAADKRTRKIDELLERPAYSAWWATKLGDWTGNTERNLPVGGEQGVRREMSEQWYDWLERRVATNVPYDEIVQGMLLGVSRRAGQSDEEFFAETTAYFRTQDRADFAARDTLPQFWCRGLGTAPQTLRVAHAFLGLRLECAECHKHPYDQWTKQDFDQFRLFFDGVRYGPTGKDLTAKLKKDLGLTADEDSGGYKALFAKLARGGTLVPWKEVTAPRPPRRPGPGAKGGPGGRVITPKLLGGDEVVATEYGDPRMAVMEWLRRPDNPYFARALVNRVWANHFGRGLVDPPDDMNLANPASNEPVLAHLAQSFVAGGFDLKALHREILASRTYRLSWRPTETNALDGRNFSKGAIRRLPAEVLRDALDHATASAERQQRLHADRAVVRERAIGVWSGLARYEGAYAVQLFGKPDRFVPCDCERSDEPSLLQTVYLRNDAEVLGLLDRKEGWLSRFVPARGKDAPPPAPVDDAALTEVFLRTVSRLPTESESEIARSTVAAAESPSAGLRDLLWAMLNTKEFALNH